MKPVVMVSACLLGELVRYDGKHKENGLVKELLKDEVEIFPICPEAEAGLGIPRPPVKLVHSDTIIIEAIGVDDTELNVTGVLRDHAYRYLAKLAGSIDGAVLKSRSPSCGIGTTELFDTANNLVGHTSGIFAETLHNHLPHLAVIDEEDFAIDAKREQFFTDVNSHYKNRF